MATDELSITLFNFTGSICLDPLGDLYGHVPHYICVLFTVCEHIEGSLISMVSGNVSVVSNAIED